MILCFTLWLCNVRTYCALYLVIVLSCVASYPIFVVYGEWVNLVIVSNSVLAARFCELPYCTDRDILFLFFRQICMSLWIKASAKCPKC